MDTLDYNIIITSRVKDRGSITWPPSQIDPTKISTVKEAVRVHAESAREVFGSLPTTRVHCVIKFEPRTTSE